MKNVSNSQMEGNAYNDVGAKRHAQQTSIVKKIIEIHQDMVEKLRVTSKKNNNRKIIEEVERVEKTRRYCDGDGRH